VLLRLCSDGHMRLNRRRFCTSRGIDRWPAHNPRTRLMQHTVPGDHPSRASTLVLRGDPPNCVCEASCQAGRTTYITGLLAYGVGLAVTYLYCILSQHTIWYPCPAHWVAHNTLFYLPIYCPCATVVRKRIFLNSLFKYS
jgi:hypothetical protein